MKDLERDMLSQMHWMDGLLRQNNPGGAVGQVTQLVVGGATRPTGTSTSAWRSSMPVELQACLLQPVHPDPLHAAGGPRADTDLEDEPPLPGRLAQAHLPVRRRRDTPRVQPGGLPLAGGRPQDGHRPVERRQVPASTSTRRARPTCCVCPHRADLRGADHSTAREPQDRHVARPAGHGRREETCIALRLVPGSAGDSGQAAQARTLQGAAKSAGPQPGSPRRARKPRPPPRVDRSLVQRLRPVRAPRTPRIQRPDGGVV